MGFLTILAIAVGLAMDAFAVSVAAGIRLGCVTGRQTFRLAFHFGFFQFMMPVIGWLLGFSVEKLISSFDHFVACGLLCIIGAKMIYDSSKSDEEKMAADPTKGMPLIGLSIATSIDALAVGLSLGVLNAGIWFPSIIIGIVAAAFTAVGIELGCKIGSVMKSRIEIFGGLILIGIGIKILMDHMFFA